MEERFVIPGVSADTPLAQAAPAILRMRFGVLIDLTRAVQGGVDADLVHDLRVASRRLREALRLLAPAYDGRGLRRWRRRVRGLTRAFGPVRDADVFVDALSQVRPGLGADGQRAAAFLAGYVLGRRERDLEHLVAVLPQLGFDSERTRVERDIERVGGREAAHEPLSAIARTTITDRIDAVRAAWVPFTGEPAPSEHHQLRIAFKQLRYAVEVFAPCYGNAFDLLYEVLKAFQDALGEMHDAQVFAEVIAERQGDGSAADVGVRRKDLDAVLAALAPAGEDAARRFASLSAAHPVDALAEALLGPLGGVE